VVDGGFPLWLRVEHFLNMLFMFFIIRAGIQILADHPRLYWNRDCTPETDWFRFLHSVPKDRVLRSKDDGHGGEIRTLDVLVPADQVWTSKSDSVTIPEWLGIPGIRHTVGPARWWHFSVNLLWVLNGAAFYGMLFATDQWQRLVPTTWTVFPNALSMLIQYWSLHFPADHSWTRYNALQQLIYFFTVFIAAPVQIGTGLMQSPAIASKLGWLGRPFNRQRARTVHFFGLVWFVFFIRLRRDIGREARGQLKQVSWRQPQGLGKQAVPPSRGWRLRLPRCRWATTVSVSNYSILFRISR
jgi:methionine sulfoxide reductase catalytic subunit